MAGADWPGNIREMANTLERAAIVSENNILTADDLLPGIGVYPSESTLSGSKDPTSSTLEEMEQKAIERALQQVDGNRKKAAELLGIELRTLYDKLKRYKMS